MNDTIKILRLKDGEDIIASYHLDEKTNIVVLNNPMSLFFKRMSMGRAMVLMNPWLPLELVEQNTAKIFVNEIMTVFEPKESLIEYYLTSVKESNELIEMNAKQIDESLRNASYDHVDEDEDEEDDEELMEELEEVVKESKRNILH